MSGVETLQRALKLSPDPFETAMILACLGKAHLEAGDATQAIPMLEQAVELADQVRSRQWRAWFRTWLGEAYLVGRQLGEARRVMGQTLEICTDVEFVAGVGFSNQALGRIAQAEGALPEAEKCLTDALRAPNSIRARFEVGCTRLFLASLAAVRGDRGAAAANLREAHSLFRTLRIPKYVERAEELAREFGA